LAVAHTQWVTLAHQDDIYRPDFTEACFDRVRKGNVNTSIVFTNYSDLVDGVRRKFSLNASVKTIMLIPFFITRSIKSRLIKKGILMFGNPICCPSVTFNKEMIGDFQFRMKCGSVLDWLAWYELARGVGGFLYVNEKLVDRRLHGASSTLALINTGAQFSDELLMFEMIWGKRIAKIISYAYRFSYRSNLL
jgi:hypothetical protein